eukprot:gene27510-34237_t
MSPQFNYTQGDTHQSHTNDSPQLDDTPLSPLRQYYSPVLCEEMLWEIGGFKSGAKAFDSKLFFFAGILWRASFGLNRRKTDFYYVVISPAQILTSDCRLLCEFSLSSAVSAGNAANTSTNDNNGHFLLEPHVCHSNRNYHFPCNEIKHKGFDRFIHKDKVALYLEGSKELHKTAAGGGKLSLKITLSTDICLQGELLGCTEIRRDVGES